MDSLELNFNTCEWVTFKTKLDHYFISNHVDKDEKKKEIVLNILDRDSYSLLTRLCLPKTPMEIKYDEIVIIITNYLKPHDNFLSRFKFYTARKIATESAIEWGERIISLAEQCKFSAIELEFLLRDLYIIGFNSGPVQEKLLKLDKNITFTKAIEIATKSQFAKIEDKQELTLASSEQLKKNGYNFIKVEKVGAKKNVGMITLNRPEVLNALCNGLVEEVGEVIDDMENDNAIGAIIITGSEKAFAAGADINEMQDNSEWMSTNINFLNHMNHVASCKKPIIAAVNGFALGGGCEFAMMCDIVYAGETAKFGQPEILLGLIPGAGGTQRLPRYVGKSKAMEMALTGYQINAIEAEKMGLVSKVFPVAELLPQSIKLAERIANNSQLIVGLCKKSVNNAYETTLSEGLNFESRSFHEAFATNDRKEGVNAFIEKRSAKFTNK